MEDLKKLMQHNYLSYASYVILDRAIPNLIDGLKPVQRRILHILWLMDDEKLHKVANVVGQTMAYHPHGDGPIREALINLANKGFLLDKQGNFGNLYTGDPAAAARYIETRLSPLAKETLFNDDLTETIPSYDGRHQEPICLPAKIPLLLLQGADGIAVGMATHLMPHNFNEVLQAEIALLKGEEFVLLPDFPTGGLMDASLYEQGKGKVKLRAKLKVRDPKTIVITEICYGTTTESLIRSIDEAAKRGKIKIDSIHDYTAEQVEIEIKLPRGQYAEEIIDALYAYTEAQVTLNSQPIVIKDNLPWEADVHEILAFHAAKLQDYLRRELEIEKERVLRKIFDKTLEQIFIENRLYKAIEKIASYEAIHEAIEASLELFVKQLSRTPSYEDREKLLNIPLRRISRFDIDKNKQEILALHQLVVTLEKKLGDIRGEAIHYLQKLIDKYGDFFKRKTEIQPLKEIDMKAIETRPVTVGFDSAAGFIGTKVISATSFECTNFDKLLLIFNDGTYKVIAIPEKQYLQQHKEGEGIAHVGVADKKTVFNVAYRDPKTHYCYAKRFIVNKFILDKSYRYFDEGFTLEFLSTEAASIVDMRFYPKVRQKVSNALFEFSSINVKNVTAKGTKMAKRSIKKIAIPKKTASSSPSQLDFL